MPSLKKDYDKKKLKNYKFAYFTHRKARRKFTKKKQLHGNLQGKIDKLQNTFMYFKSEFTNKFETFENIFQTYADVTNKPITINTNNKLSEVNEKIFLENEQ